MRTKKSRTDRKVLIYVLPFLVLAFAAAAEKDKAAEALAGQWEGALDAGGTQLPLVVHVERSESGELSASLDSPRQGVEGLPIASVTLEDAVVELDVQVIGARFEGKLAEDGRSIDGHWRQNGMELPLVLERKAAPGG